MSEADHVLRCAEALLEERRLMEAALLFDRAEAEGNDSDRCAAGRWTTAMLSGDYASAWRESDAIRRRGKADPARFWQGEEIHGKRIMLRCLHGLGDCVQFLRYAPRLKACAASLMVECAPSAEELVRCQPGVDEVITWGSSGPEKPPQWDVQLEIMELPYFFRTTLADLPIATNYLALSPVELDRVANMLGCSTDGPRIGVVWSSGEWNLARSIPLAMLAPVLRRSDLEFWNLQGGAVRHEWHTLGLGTHLRDTSLLADAGTVPLAAFIAQLDLVVTVDTLAAHLAGALAIPCFLLLQHAADWRWMVGRDDSPWYPSLRLFRQPCAGDWASAIHALNHALTIFFDEHATARIFA